MEKVAVYWLRATQSKAMRMMAKANAKAETKTDNKKSTSKPGIGTGPWKNRWAHARCDATRREYDDQVQMAFTGKKKMLAQRIFAFPTYNKGFFNIYIRMKNLKSKRSNFNYFHTKYCCNKYLVLVSFSSYFWYSYLIWEYSITEFTIFIPKFIWFILTVSLKCWL